MTLSEIEATLQGGILGVAAAFGETTIVHNADVVFPTASCIKIAIVEELFQQGLDLAQPVTISAADFVGGSGVLGTLTAPVTLPLGDLATLTLSISDNTASNACLRAAGGPEVVNARLRSWGITGITIHRPIKFALEPGDPPHTATGTPAEFLSLLGKLSEDTRAKMAFCTDSAMLPRYLSVNPYATDLRVDTPPYTVVHKTGGVEGVRNDVGYVTQGDNEVRIAIFTKEVPDPRWTPENLGSIAVGRATKWLCDSLLP
ncbi:MAG: serine hydrolase [Armatimonas sp.]